MDRKYWKNQRIWKLKILLRHFSKSQWMKMFSKSMQFSQRFLSFRASCTMPLETKAYRRNDCWWQFKGFSKNVGSVLLWRATFTTRQDLRTKYDQIASFALVASWLFPALWRYISNVFGKTLELSSMIFSATSNTMIVASIQDKSRGSLQK